MSELLTIKEVATQLRVDDATVRRWAKNGAIKEEDIVILPHMNERCVYRIKLRALDRVLGKAS